jgi:hypothetical protein
MRKSLGLVAALALAAATLGGGTAEARRGWHHGHGDWYGGGGLALGLIGGALLGSAISRPYYYGYGPGYGYSSAYYGGYYPRYYGGYYRRQYPRYYIHRGHGHHRHYGHYRRH